MVLIIFVLIIGSLVIGITSGVLYGFASIPYSSGGEVRDSLSMVQVSDLDTTQKWFPYGQHFFPNYEQQTDLDGDFNEQWTLDDYERAYPDQVFNAQPYTWFQDPAISIETSDVYYMQEVGNVFAPVEDLTISKSFEKTFGNTTYRYSLVDYGFDVTIKTDADKYQVTAEKFGFGAPWGYWAETNVVDVDTLINFGTSPYIPIGSWNGSYDIVGGWAGILSAQVYDYSFGVVQNERLQQEMDTLGDIMTETDTTIQDLNSINSLLNIYLPSSQDALQEIEFSNAESIRGIRNAVNVEIGAKLGAGTVYTPEQNPLLIGYHAAALAVRNVYVTYRIVVKMVTTLDLKLVAIGDPITTPDEGNTAGDPPPSVAQTWLDEFWADVSEWFAENQLFFYVILIGVFSVIIAFFYFRRPK